MRLEAIDMRDLDDLIAQCDSEECTDSKYTKSFEDNVQWTWSVTKGGFILDKSFPSKPKKVVEGRYVIYEAPKTLNQPFEEIEFKLTVTDRFEDEKPLTQERDDNPGEHTFKIKVYRAGVKLQRTPAAWLPEHENMVPLESKLMYESAQDEWEEAFAHMCRIHFFQLDDVSTEKGHCNNKPEKEDADNCRDLRLKEQQGLEAYKRKRMPKPDRSNLVMITRITYLMQGHLNRRKST